ncbi:uncharacterized protein LOC127258212 [Andrographis paniculata]|uniref:uncharacterized protein LOC127258212 n=1 Tax=Andrographis paniculata TaxID=175694 RepID=UPI0021E72873|nr:uncharacterized protein LOC127258212 [Andrographis paniculata]XP_051140933.1 uncharacterized protein LOC127258212 [Andrographis paniculata]
MASIIHGANTTTKGVYRSLLKAVKQHIGKKKRNSPFFDYISHEFRKDASNSSPNLKLASDYTFYLKSVHHHKELLFSHNIAVDRSDEMKKVIGKSAASVGLRLPDVYQP